MKLPILVAGSVAVIMLTSAVAQTTPSGSGGVTMPSANQTPEAPANGTMPNANGTTTTTGTVNSDGTSTSTTGTVNGDGATGSTGSTTTAPMPQQCVPSVTASCPPPAPGCPQSPTQPSGTNCPPTPLPNTR